MKRLSIALIVWGIAMCVFMSDITAAVLCIAMGLAVPAYRALVAWVYRHRHRKDRLLFVDFAKPLTSEE